MSSGWSARRRASSAAFAWARSTRRCSVRRPRSASQASNGPGVLPCTSRRPLSTSWRSSSRVTIAPSCTSLWPARYLVAECSDHVGAELERPLQQRGEERVVDDHAGAGVAGRGDDRGGVGHLERRVGRRLEPDQRGVLARLDHGRGVRYVDDRRGEPAAELEVGELDQGAVVGVPRHHHLVAERDQVEEAGDRRHPGRVRQAPAALQRAQRALERGPRRVAVAAVLEVPTGDVRRRHRDRRVERLVGLVRRPARGDGDGRGPQ